VRSIFSFFNYSRDQSERYIVRLPVKEGPPRKIGDPRAAAFCKLANLNRGLDRNSDLKKEYNSILSEYKQLGHMEKVPAVFVPVSSSDVFFTML